MSEEAIIKKFMYVNRKSPYGTIYALESLEVVLISAAFDQDVSSIHNELNSPKFKLINANFRFIKNFLKMEGVDKVDGILADLGISSHQIDVPSRGFSTRFNGDLDMRMNVNSYLTAKDVVNNYSEEHLSNLFFHTESLEIQKKYPVLLYMQENLLRSQLQVS